MCKIDGCSERVKARALCSRHYSRQWHTGDPLTPFKNSPAPAECRIGECASKPQAHGLCSKHLWRLRTHGDPEFDVRASGGGYKPNGDKADNRLENLELWTTMQPSGKRVEDLVAYAHIILGRYSDMV